MLPRAQPHGLDDETKVPLPDGARGCTPTIPFSWQLRLPCSWALEVNIRAVPWPGAGAGLGSNDMGRLGTGFQVKAVLDEILEKIPETFNMAEIMAKATEKTPYVVVAFQECERMNILTNEMRRSLKELNLGLKVRTTGAAGPGLGPRRGLAATGQQAWGH